MAMLTGYRRPAEILRFSRIFGRNYPFPQSGDPLGVSEIRHIVWNLGQITDRKSVEFKSEIPDNAQAQPNP